MSSGRLPALSSFQISLTAKPTALVPLRAKVVAFRLNLRARLLYEASWSGGVVDGRASGRSAHKASTYHQTRLKATRARPEHTALKTEWEEKSDRHGASGELPEMKSPLLNSNCSDSDYVLHHGWFWDVHLDSGRSYFILQLSLVYVYNAVCN